MNQIIQNIARESEGIIVCLTGEIDMHHTPGFHERMVDLCNEKPARLILDLADVSYIDSSGVGSLVDVFRKLKKVNRKLILVAPSERVQSVLEITKLDQFFTIVGSQEEAKTQ